MLETPAFRFSRETLIQSPGCPEVARRSAGQSRWQVDKAKRRRAGSRWPAVSWHRLPRGGATILKLCTKVHLLKTAENHTGGEARLQFIQTRSPEERLPGLSGLICKEIGTIALSTFTQFPSC